ncbi:MAG: AP2 domain-containing protein [Robiginitomaculum sp.]|nr:MAG: AP2 domain-containing protein [Robiginitomaculum sp.]
MSSFVEIPATRNSMMRRKIHYGIGINDAPYMTSVEVSGKMTQCPVYRMWVNMLKRCYDNEFHKKNPTYIGCSVSIDWWMFSKFREWVKNKDWIGKQLDKDLLIQGNKVYSSGTCVFVSREVNNITGGGNSATGEYPQGVTMDNGRGKLFAQIKIMGKVKFLGYFKTATEAHDAYKIAKYARISEVANEQTDERLKLALLNYKINGDK